MRDFVEIQREFDLVLWVERPLGNLHLPRARLSPRLIVRRFDRDVPPALALTCSGLLTDANAWVQEDDTLARLVRVEEAKEVGTDFLARGFFLGNDLGQFLDPDAEDPVEPPEELTAMQARFRERAAGCADRPVDKVLTRVLARSLLQPTRKTIWSFSESRFIIADVKPTLADLREWEAVDPK